MSKPFNNRIVVYFTERFPFFLYFFLVVILYLSMSILAQLLSGNNPVIDKYTMVGIVSNFFVMLLIRTFDDLKDVALDNEIFPDRPVSRGAVLLSDVKILAVFSFVILVLVNVLFAPKTLVLFSVMLIYALLTFKWFFAEKLHIDNPKIAMITHQPLPIIIMFFLLHTALASGSVYDVFTYKHLLLLLVFALPITAWEVSRKIKAPINENKYETFSKIFGVKTAVLIPIVLYSIAGFISIWLSIIVKFHFSYSIIIVSYLLFLIVNFLRFYFNPTPKNNNLQKTAMIFTTLFFLTLALFLLFQHAIILQL